MINSPKGNRTDVFEVTFPRSMVLCSFHTSKNIMEERKDEK